jgi:regulator of RNase E activity RraA
MAEVRLHRRTKSRDPAPVDRPRRILVPNVFDVLQRMAGAADMHGIGNSSSSLGGRAILGPAMTVRMPLGDDLVVHKHSCSVDDLLEVVEAEDQA